MENDYPEYTRVQQPRRSWRSLISLLIGIILLVLLLALIFWGFRSWRQSRSSQSLQAQQDTHVRQELDKFGTYLYGYYTKNSHYPSENELETTNNTPGITYTYTASASNGDTCKNTHPACTRVVISTKLSNNRTYTVILDKNKVQKY